MIAAALVVGLIVGLVLASLGFLLLLSEYEE